MSVAGVNAPVLGPEAAPRRDLKGLYHRWLGSIVPSAVPAGTPESLQPLLHRWLLALLALGLVWRALRYCLQFPIWGDEAFICLNLVHQDYAGLTGPLRCSQVAPLLFLWGELSAFFCLGPSPLALRLLPFLAGVGGLLLTWRLAHLTLPPLARTLAVAFLAVAVWPVSMSTLIKPYALDLLAASALLVAAVQWLQRPERTRWLLLLALLTPLAVFSSYPVVFVAGGISLALLPTAWRQPGWNARAGFVLFNLLLAGSFLGNYLFVGLNQLDRTTGSVNSYLQDYWSNGFPPHGVLATLWWFVLLDVGRMFAYPVGGADGLSAATTLLFLIGLVVLWRRRQRTYLVLFLTPFALGVVAAFLRRYPYGGCCRLSQHVAPIICLLAGAGAAALLERIRSVEGRRRWINGVCGLFACVGLGGMLVDVVHPYRGEIDVWWARLVHTVDRQRGPEDQIVVLGGDARIDVVLRWELTRVTLQGGHVAWSGQPDEERLRTGSGQVWVLDLGAEPDAIARLHAALQRSQRPWKQTTHVPYTVVPSRKRDPVVQCAVSRYVATDASDPQPLSCWP